MREEQSLKPKKNITGPRRKARELAVQALYQYDFGHMDYDRLESLSWLAGDFAPAEETVAYFKSLLSGSLQNLEKVDETIKESLKKDDFNQMMTIDRAVLRLMAYCLLFEKETPAVILINEGIELSKGFGGKDAHKFVNGVLNEVRKRLVERGDRRSEEFAERSSQS